MVAHPWRKYVTLVISRSDDNVAPLERGGQRRRIRRRHKPGGGLIAKAQYRVGCRRDRVEAELHRGNFLGGIAETRSRAEVDSQAELAGAQRRTVG